MRNQKCDSKLLLAILAVATNAMAYARPPLLMNEDCFHYFLQAGSTAQELRQLGGEVHDGFYLFNLFCQPRKTVWDPILENGL